MKENKSYLPSPVWHSTTVDSAKKKKTNHVHTFQINTERHITLSK